MTSGSLDGLEAMEALPCVTREANALVRQLALQTTIADRNRAICMIENAPHEILLDIETDGLRCLLLRAQSRPERLQDHLSPREQEIARMVAGGYANKTIAAVLEISVWTVGTYLRRIYAKLGVSTRAAMVARLLDETAFAASTRCVHESRLLR